MENQEFKKLLKFHGDHGTLVGLRIMNNILKVVTLGLYYPWARASVLNYMYGETEFQQSRFVFHGTGKEMFRGFIKALALLIVLYGFLFYCTYTKDPTLAIVGALVFFFGISLIIPLAIHGSAKYRLSRSSWRGIHFGYRGKLNEFFKSYMYHWVLTIVTFGIYGAWFNVAIRKYIYENARFGNVQFSFHGRGGDLFLLRLKGIFLSIITLGIYLFWYMKELVEFELNNLKITQNGREIRVRTTISAGQIFSMIVVNYFIIVFTLGIGTGIAINRVMRMSLDNIEFDDAIDSDTLVQTEAEYKDATGDDLSGLLDIWIF